MEFIFQITSCGDPSLEAEAAELLRQRAEAYSRQVLPGMWNITDRLNARHPGRNSQKQRLVLPLLVTLLGVFALLSGCLGGPKIPGLIAAGLFALAVGLAQIIARRVRRNAPSRACRKEAAELLRQRRETDWDALQASVCFDETGWTVTTAEGSSQTSYERLWSVFQSDRLWLLVTEGDMALLLQKKDLISGEVEEFLPFLQDQLQNLSYKGEST